MSFDGVLLILVLGLAAISVLLRKRSTRPSASLLVSEVDKSTLGAGPYPYVFVNDDGTVRDLHSEEREYLETEFHPADGGRPYVKRSYSAKDGWGSIGGYLQRRKLPRGSEVLAAPSDNPSKPMSKEKYVEFLGSKGLVVTENPDGTFTAKKPTS